MGMKRTQGAAGIRSEGEARTKRKAAEASSAKIKEIADVEDGRNKEDYSEDEAIPELPMVAHPRVKHATKKVEKMPLVAPGLWLWKGFSEVFAGTDLASLAKYDEKTPVDAKTVDVQRKYGITLKPLMVTEGPLTGCNVLVLESTPGFRFLDLPPEIRNKVYGYLLEEANPIGIHTYSPVRKPVRSVRAGYVPGSYTTRAGLTWDKETCKWIGEPPSAFALLRVCKQMLQETAPVAYGNNTFSPRSFRDAHVWFNAIGSMRRYVRRFQLPERAHGRSHLHTIFSKLQTAVDLRSIIVDHSNVCSQSWEWLCTYRPAALASRLAPLLKALKKAFVRNGTRSPRDLLEILTVTYETCHQCKIGHHERCSDYKSNCDTTCAELDEHCQDLQVEFRSAVASVLGMEEEL